MKRGISLIIFIAAIFLISSVSAEIILIQQPSPVYSLGDVVSIPATIKASKDTSGILNMDLLCNGLTVNFYKNGISLKSGEEKKIDSALVLTKDIIGELKGQCKIKATLGNEFALTNEFKVSDSVKISIEFAKIEFNPGESIFLEGSAVKENGADVDGFVEMYITEENSSKIFQIGTVDNGFFEINTTIPKDMKAGTYILTINAYEKILDERTNQGFLGQSISIRQVPTSLEVVFDSTELDPGSNMRAKVILHDQTGQNIPQGIAFITIKNNNDKILEQAEVATDEFFEYTISKTTPPAKWKVIAVSSKLNAEASFKILAKESVSVNVINKTIEITNTGNIPYNNTVLVRIGSEPVAVPVFLPVGSTQEYVLTAPDGSYKVEIVTPGQNNTIVDEVALTGKAIDVKQASSNIVSLVRYPVIWIFLILVLGFVAFIVYKRGYQRSFFGYIRKKVPGKTISEIEPVAVSKSSMIKTQSPAILSLSIKGDKQPATFMSLHIKNLHSIQSKKGPSTETLQAIVNMAESKKASVYETGGHLFFILAPANTRTFSNEKPALDLALNAKQLLSEHNRKFKDKIEFGLALTSGTIVAKRGNSGALGFMTLGNLIAISKKLSSGSKGDVLLDESSASKLKEHIKPKKQKHGSLEYYTIDQIKDSEEHRKFLAGFLQRMEKDSKE